MSAITNINPRLAMLQCDCCAQYVARDQIARCWAYGIETYACAACRGVPPEDDENELATARWNNERTMA